MAAEDSSPIDPSDSALSGKSLRYLRTLEGMLEGAQIIDADYRYVYLNPAAAQHGRRRREDLVGRTMMESYPGIEHTDVFAAIRRGLEQKTATRVETRFTYPDGAVGWFELSIQPVPEGIFILSIDVTGRKRAEDELQQANADLERRVQERTAALEAANEELQAFNYSVSHDLRAPLRAVDSFAGILADDYGGDLPVDAHQLIDRIRSGVQRMGRLIDDLLAFSGVARQSLVPAFVDMEALVADAVREVRDAAPPSPAEIRVGALPPANGDGALLRQVWVNLISNALKYSRKRPAPLIEIGARVESGKDIYFVRDNGAGFDMRYAANLFGAFQRMHPRDQFEGTGVGLAIVHRIVARHGGRIWAEAVPDKGATFSFTLPRAT